MQSFDATRLHHVDGAALDAEGRRDGLGLLSVHREADEDLLRALVDRVVREKLLKRDLVDRLAPGLVVGVVFTVTRDA